MSRAERWVRRAARAFPPRWRRTSGEALVGTALEMTGDVDDRPPWSLLADIVRAGCGQRWRDRPPPWSWIGYAYFGSRTAATRHRAWVRDDISGRLYPLRLWLRFVPVLTVVLVLGVQPVMDRILRPVGGGLVRDFLVEFAAVTLLVFVGLAPTKRRQAATRFGIALSEDVPDGTPQPHRPGDVGARRRR